MLKSLSTVWPYLRRYRKGLSLGIGSLVMKAVLASALPLVIRQGVDAMSSGVQLSSVLRFAALLVVVALLKGVFQYWMRVIIIGISRDIEFDLRNDLFRHWLLGFGSGDLVIRTGGANSQTFTMANVLFVGSKLATAQRLLQERSVVRG